MRRLLPAFLALFFVVAWIPRAAAQPYGEPDRGEPGDRMIQEHLSALASDLERQFDFDIQKLEEWERRRPAFQEQYLDMLGLAPLPERTPLQATVTGSLEGAGFVVDLLHYQSRPGLYVTANLYRPAQVAAGERLPAVLYVCGHSGRGRNGNKTAFQSHGMWFARHGYVCLVVDTLQLGEIAATHHGTYHEARWWWHSRGYTPAGVECWNGVRGIDYLFSRPDVDPERIAVTGISGGGAATFWVAAADERVKVAVPVSGMADLPSYVSNRVINGHCDCMFLYNAHEWPWVRIAALIAPRPLLFVNSDKDPIFPMDANERISNRLERLYSLYGAGENVDAVVSVGGHDYRRDIRRAVFRFINVHLRGDARPIDDSEVDLVNEPRGGPYTHPIDPARLRVFPTDADLPPDELNTTIDRHFVPLAQVAVPAAGEFPAWQKTLRGELRRAIFRRLPEQGLTASVKVDEPDGSLILETESDMTLRVERVAAPADGVDPARLVLIVQAQPGAGVPEWFQPFARPGDVVFLCPPRGVDATRWTQRNPPNYVERSHVLVGRTVDTSRVYDVNAVASRLHQRRPRLPLHLTGTGAAGIIAAYAALWTPGVSGVLVHDPPTSHMDPAAPQFLGILRHGDIPDLLGLLAPTPLTIVSSDQSFEKVSGFYQAANAVKRLTREEGQ